MGEPDSKQASPTLTPCIPLAEPSSSSAFPELVLETPNLALARLVADLFDGFPGLGALGVALVTLFSSLLTGIRLGAPSVHWTRTSSCQTNASAWTSRP